MLRPDPLATGVGGARPSYLTPACELEKIDIPTFSPYITRMSILNPDLWSREVARQLKSSSTFRAAFAPDALLPEDFWNGEEPGYYDEAVALARLFGVRVHKSLWQGADEFVLHMPSAPHRRIPLCSPTELVFQIKRYAEDYLPETT